MKQKRTTRSIFCPTPLLPSYIRHEQYKNAISFFDAMANEEWLVEQELPSFHKQWLQQCRAEHQSEALRMRSALRAASFFLPSAQTPSFDASSFASPLLPALADRCIYIHAIPPRCTRRCLLDWLRQFDGLDALFFGDAFRCPPAELDRPAFALFASPAQTLAAFRSMMGKHVPLRDTACLGLNGLKEEEDGEPHTFIMRCSLWKPAEKLPPLRGIANSPRRIEADRRNCRALWAAAERFWVHKEPFFHHNRGWRRGCWGSWRRPRRTGRGFRRTSRWTRWWLCCGACSASITGPEPITTSSASCFTLPCFHVST